MTEMPRLRLQGDRALVLVLAVAGGARYWYLPTCDNANGPGPWAVQDPWPDAGERSADKDRRSELDALVESLKKDGRFAYRAPLADTDEITAHTAPGYPWLLAQVAQLLVDPFQAVRWIQCGTLGALTAGCISFSAAGPSGTCAWVCWRVWRAPCTPSGSSTRRN